MKIALKYGHDPIQLKIPETADIIQSQEPRKSGINKKSFCSRLAAILPDNLDKYEKVGIVVSDKTRLCDYPLYLPWITETLKNKGADKGNITFFIAYGNHSKQTDEECTNSYGKTYRQYKFIHHDSRDPEAFAILGLTNRGTTISFRKDILECSLLITFGAISYHYFAGYGGGRKLLFPGLGNADAIYHNHGLFLDRDQRKLSVGCQPGNLENNPLAEDLKEIDSYMPARISVHGIVNAAGKVCELLIGKTYDDFVSACQLHDSYFKIISNKQYNLVVASCGGHPKDINFIQAHKSLHHSASLVKDRGSLVIFAECKNGIGSEDFLKFLEIGSFEKTFEILEKNYHGNGGTALSLMVKTNRIKVYLVTYLNNKICETLKTTKIDVGNVQRMIDDAKDTIAIIKNASMIVCRPK
jgi:nickel-dependent lactate racemase